MILELTVVANPQNWNVQCSGSKRYTVRCGRWTTDSSGECYQHRGQRARGVSFNDDAVPEVVVRSPTLAWRTASP